MQNQIIDAINNSPLNRGLDGRTWLSTPHNVPIVFENGDIALFDALTPSEYEVHILFQSRGRQAIDHLKDAFRQMFTDHCADLIIGMVPDFRRDVKLVARLAGGNYVGQRMTQHGECALFVLSKAKWKGAN